VRDDLLLTHKSSIVGTPGYMSPEQIRGEELTTQTDLFSSGIVVYELFTGTNPFIGKDIKDTINNILDFNAEKDLKQLSSLPPKVQNVVINLLRKNFSKRTKTALEALSFFEPLEESTPEVAPESSTVRKINLKILYLSAIAIIIIALIGFFTSERNGKKPTAKADKKITNENVPPKKDILNKNDEKNSVPNTSTKEEDKVVPESEKILETVRYGKLFVEANPWAEIYINDKKIETTPLEQSPYIEKIKIEPDKVQNVKINFYEKVGYLDCKIFPWGDIYIDGNYKSTSPLLKPIMLMPGSYDLSIRNPSYEKSIEKKITVKAKETLTLKFNFDNN
jgi:serine/threonine protein kinase